MAGKRTDTDARSRVEELLSSDFYRENLDFWDRAWGGVKTAYTQLPDLPYLEMIPETLTERKVKTVLDLGCGSGWLSVYLARQGFKVTGLDISVHAIELGRQWAEKESLAIEFTAGDIADMPFSQGSFDAIVANSIFEHFPLDMSYFAIDTLRSVLIEDGVFIGCFDNVGGGPGEYFTLDDETHVYTDKARKGMLLRNYSDQELDQIFEDWTIDSKITLESGSRLVVALNQHHR